MEHHYDAHKSNMKCEVFLDYESEAELLRAIAHWWNKSCKETTKSFLEHIRINYDSDTKEPGITAEVHWSYS